MVNVNWPTAVAGEADIVSSVSASACHIGGPPIDVNPGELALVYGTVLLLHFLRAFFYCIFQFVNEFDSPPFKMIEKKLRLVVPD